jgi:hypothetical protein
VRLPAGIELSSPARVPHFEFYDAIAIQVEEIFAWCAAVIQDEEPSSARCLPECAENLYRVLRIAAEGTPIPAVLEHAEKWGRDDRVVVLGGEDRW